MVINRADMVYNDGLVLGVSFNVDSHTSRNGFKRINRSLDNLTYFTGTS